ncbi:MAG TPA: hypothetical protein EYP41_11900 [Anaerolineae bacterium]|nr:hypothetical protein [Anaerolineae bacterium]
MNSGSVKFLLDEHIWEGLAEALRKRGYDVVHINHTEFRGIDDEPLLEMAAAEGRAVLTNNHRDFAPLVRFWYEDGRKHAGVILSVQLRPGILFRQVESLLESLSADELMNSIRWLQEFR